MTFTAQRIPLGTILALFSVINLLAEEPYDTESLIHLLLQQDLGTRRFTFSEVIHAGCGKKVIAFDSKNEVHQEIKNAIEKAADDTQSEMNQSTSPIRKLRRINEASRFFENYLMKHLNSLNHFSCTIPKNNNGNEQRSGYPDLLITHTSEQDKQTYVYLDPKLYEEKSRASSLRTFYYEPRSRTNKIQHNALHLLIGFSHDGKDGAWTFINWEIVDLSTLSIRLKAEFQSSNRDIYRAPQIIKASKGANPTTSQ